MHRAEYLKLKIGTLCTVIKGNDYGEIVTVSEKHNDLVTLDIFDRENDKRAYPYYLVDVV